MSFFKRLTKQLTPTESDLPEPTPPQGEEGSLALQAQLAALRLELDERENQINALRQEVERLQTRQEQQIQETVRIKLEGLFNDLAAPISQALTQAELLENQGKPVQARDVLALTRRMIRAVERAGLVIEGSVGQSVSFDPDRHTPIQSSIHFQSDQPVKIRFVGVSYQGKIIAKAIVEE